MVLCASLVTRPIKSFRLEQWLSHLTHQPLLEMYYSKRSLQDGRDLHRPRTNCVPRRAKRMLDASRHECMSRVLGNLCESPQAKLFKTTIRSVEQTASPWATALDLEHIDTRASAFEHESERAVQHLPPPDFSERAKCQTLPAPGIELLPNVFALN